MVSGKKVKCNYCGKIFLLRFQIGTMNIKFSFSCPECGVTIFGYQEIETKGNLKIINASEIVSEDKLDYYLTLSTEFPNTKISKFVSDENMKKNSISPFMESVNYFKTMEEYNAIIDKIREFNIFRTKWPMLKAYYEIWYHNKIRYLIEPLKNISECFVIKSKLDVIMALHQCTTTKYILILEKNILNYYSTLGEKIICSEKKVKVIDFINYLKLKINFDKIAMRVVDIYSRWINDFEIYLPVVLLELREDKTKSISKNNGIYSDYYKVLSFYQDSYELILDLIVFAIGMNNIEIRNDYNCFPEKIGVNDFEKLYKNAKYNRINFIKDDEPYFKYINMDRNIRNSIAHFDYEYDNELQLFTFHDSGKEGEVSRKITLYDFEVICFKNLKMIIYLNEIFYSIRKLSCLDDGLTLNIESDFKNKQIKI